MNFGLIIGGLIAICMVGYIAIAILLPLTDSLTISGGIDSPAYNVTSSLAGFVSLDSNIYPMLIIGTIITIGLFIFLPLRNVDESITDNGMLVPAHKQTYLEYVQERLAVERLLK
ncbi:hypothetical protein M0R04_14645 [Candidatus Dojkabacteria bacterium]|jgi:hypothetical protein|nr:hypothetical protein [Candidatus Dojkabacteria bacterium]